MQLHGLPIIRAGISRHICQGVEERPISVASSLHVGLQADWLRCFRACYTCVAKNAAALNPLLIFFSAMVWALLSATLAAISNSRYIAYGGSFVIYYILVILHDRYFEDIYCLYPYEWIQFQHTWLFDEQGIVILLSSLSALLFLIYYNTVRRCIERV